MFAGLHGRYIVVVTYTWKRAQTAPVRQTQTMMMSSTSTMHVTGSDVQQQQQLPASSTSFEHRGSDLHLLKGYALTPSPEVNPFIGTWTSLSGWRLAKVIALSPLGVLRVFLAVAIVALASAMCSLLLLVSGTEHGAKPPRWVTSAGLPVIRYGSRCVLFVFGVWWIPVRGKCDQGARVLVSNHTCFLDVLVLLWLCAPSFLSKQTVLTAPLLGSICRVLQVVGVDRTSKDDKGRSKAEMTRLIEDKVLPPVLVFPEGTTTRTDTLMRFKPGAFIFGVAVQPIVLHWHWTYFDIANTATTPPLLWLLQLATQVYVNVSVDLLSTVHPDEQEVSNALHYALSVRKVIFACMERGSARPVVDCEQSVDDFLMWQRFLRAKHPDPRAALRTLSIAQLRAVISLASPASRQAITLGVLLACGKRYLAALPDSRTPLLSLQRLARLATGVEGEPVFCAAFAQACAFPCDDWLDVRAFAMGLAVLSPLSQVWGAAPAYDSADPGVRRWAQLRCRLAFSALAPGQERLDKAACEAKLGCTLPIAAASANVLEFVEAVTANLVGLPAPAGMSEPDALNAWAEQQAVKRANAHAFIEQALRCTDEAFKAAVSASSQPPPGLWLSDKEVDAEERS